MDTTLRGQRLAAAGLGLWTLVALGLPWVPGVGVPGYLQAFVCGVLAPLLLAPPLFALARRLEARTAWPGVWCILLGMALGALPAVVTTGVGAARDVLCAPRPAWAHVLLGPVMAGAVVGATARCVTAWVKPGWRAGAAYLSVVALLVGHTLWGLYAHPQVFALDHYFGHFRGPLYDEGNPSFERPLVLRAVSLAYVAALLALARLATQRRGEDVLLAVASLALWGGAHLGAAGVLAPGREGLLAALSTTLRSPHAEILLDGARWPLLEQRRLQAEVERHITEIQEQLGLASAEPVQLFLYASADEKFRLLGASTTLLARPWAHELHVQGGSVPVGALRHELSHVLLAEVSGGPLGVSSVLGILPNMLLVEGMAVALEEDEGRLTLVQQAALMKKLGRLPSVDVLTRPWGFWLESGARAYTAAGAFLRFVGEQRGGPALAAIYRDGGLPADVAALESAWHAQLDGVEVPEAGVGAQFTRIFKRASVVERRCVDEVAEMWTTAHAASAARNWDGAERAFGRILSLDEGDDEPLLQLLEALSHGEDEARWRGVMAQLEARGPDAVATARIAQAAAEAAIRAGRLDEAGGHLDRALPLVKGSSQERSVRLLRFAVDAAGALPCEAPARAVLEFLAGDGPHRARGRSDLLALERGFNAASSVEKQCAGILSAVRYLQGRQLVADDPARAEEALAQAIQLGLPVDLFRRETARLRGEAAEHAGRFEDAAAHYAEARRLGVTPGEHAEAAMLEKRARFAAHADP